jgi:hypothetical protein
MSCYTCTGCTATTDMSQCFEDVTFGQFPVGFVNLTFVSTVDGSQFTATGEVTVADLTILAEDLPSFTSGVAYRVTSDVAWTLDSTVRSCVSIRFVVRKDANGLVTGTNEVVTFC